MKIPIPLVILLLVPAGCRFPANPKSSEEAGSTEVRNGTGLAPLLVPELTPTQRSVSAAAFSKDCKFLLTGYNVWDERRRFNTDQIITLWDVETGKAIRFFPGDRQKPSNGVQFLAYLPGKERFIAGYWHNTDYPFKIWSQEGKFLRGFGEPGEEVGLAALSKDGRRMMSFEWTSGYPKLWNVPEGKLIKTYPDFFGRPSKISLSQDGKTALITCSPFANGSREDEGGVRLFDVASGKTEQYFRTTESIEWEDASFSPTEDTIFLTLAPRATPQKTELVYWNIAAKKVEKTLKVPWGCPCFTPDGKTAISQIGRGEVLFWDPNSGEEIRKVTLKRGSEGLPIKTISENGNLALVETGWDQWWISGRMSVLQLEIWDLQSSGLLQPLHIPPADQGSGDKGSSDQLFTTPSQTK